MAVIQSATETNPNSLIVVANAGIVHVHCGSIDDALTVLWMLISANAQLGRIDEARH